MRLPSRLCWAGREPAFSISRASSKSFFSFKPQRTIPPSPANKTLAGRSPPDPQPCLPLPWVARPHRLSQDGVSARTAPSPGCRLRKGGDFICLSWFCLQLCTRHSCKLTDPSTYLPPFGSPAALSTWKGCYPPSELPSRCSTTWVPSAVPS